MTREITVRELRVGDVVAEQSGTLGPVRVTKIEWDADWNHVTVYGRGGGISSRRPWFSLNVMITRGPLAGTPNPDATLLIK